MFALSGDSVSYNCRFIILVLFVFSILIGLLQFGLDESCQIRLPAESVQERQTGVLLVSRCCPVSCKQCVSKHCFVFMSVCPPVRVCLLIQQTVK